jgi:hypothetical protein
MVAATVALLFALVAADVAPPGHLSFAQALLTPTPAPKREQQQPSLLAVARFPGGSEGGSRVGKTEKAGSGAPLPPDPPLVEQLANYLVRGPGGG